MRGYIAFLFMLPCIIPAWSDIQINSNWEQPGWQKSKYVKHYDNTARLTSLFACDNTEHEKNSKLNNSFYEKLANYLLNSDYMKYNDETKEYHRLIEIKITASQLQEFKNSQGNLAAMDAIMFEAVSDVKNSVLITIAEKITEIFNTLIFSLSAFINVEDFVIVSGFIVFTFVVFLFARLFNRNVVIVGLIIIFCIAYLIDYRKCGLKQEIRALVELEDLNYNHCNFKPPTTYFGVFKQLFSVVSEDKCIEQIVQKNNKFASDKYCNVWNHFVDYVIKGIILGMVNILLDCFKEIRAKLSFPYSIIVNAGLVYVVAILMKTVLVRILDLFFIYNTGNLAKPRAPRHPIKQNQKSKTRRSVERIQDLQVSDHEEEKSSNSSETEDDTSKDVLNQPKKMITAKKSKRSSSVQKNNLNVSSTQNCGMSAGEKT